MTAVAVEVATVAPTVGTPRRPQRRTLGPLVGAVAAEMGWGLFPYQQHILDVAMEVTDTGHFAYRTVVLSMPRRGGKSMLLQARSLWRMMTQDQARISYLSQSGKDSVALFRELSMLLEASPTFRKRLRTRSQNGQESIWFKHNHSEMRFDPPHRKSLHGRLLHDVLLDEMWSLEVDNGEDLLVAARPTMATVKDAPGPQIWMTSSAGDERSVWWEAQLDRGRQAVDADTGQGVAFFEWAAGPEDDLDDPAVWEQMHPAVAAGLIDVDFLREERQMLSPESFARAYGNRRSAGIKRVIGDEVWNRARTSTRLPATAEVAFGVDVAFDRSESTIVAAGRGDDGSVLVEVVEQRPGTQWVAPRLVELVERHSNVGVGVDRLGPANSVAEDLEILGCPVVPLKTQEVTAAASAVYDRLHTNPAPTLRHNGDGRLTAAVQAAVKRPVGDAWAWGRKTSSGSISPLVAATVAVWALDHPVQRKKIPGIW